MHHFFVESNQIKGQEIFLTGEDYNHAVRVLRLKEGEKVLISGPKGEDYICRVTYRPSPHAKDHIRGAAQGEDTIRGASQGVETIRGAADISRKNPGEKSLRLLIDEESEGNHELPSELTLFQCIPKGDTMDEIIRKAVELGVNRIVPVFSKNTVVKLDERKTAIKLERWQSIALSAAKQSKRSIVPEVKSPMIFKDAVKYCETMDLRLIPYEGEQDLTRTSSAIINILPGRSIGVFIGPEGGFDPLEIKMAIRHGIYTLSLGRRILKVETAAIATLSLIMIRLELSSWMDLSV